MRLLFPLLAAALMPAAAPAQDAAQVAAREAPVVVELFTSQGCSSCPPADELLTELAGHEGVIALALHVDYWDYLGWKDAFGRPGSTARQKAYAKAAKSRSIFTPEMVVQGSARVKGHDAERILAEIAEARRKPAEAALELERDGDVLAIHLAPTGAGTGGDTGPGSVAGTGIETRAGTGPADVHLVRFLPSADVEIGAGENAGRSMTYTNIVTGWETIARWDGTAAVDMRYEGLEDGPVAVIVQRKHMGPILAAATAE
jgi:hypothetical protein